MTYFSAFSHTQEVFLFKPRLYANTRCNSDFLLLGKGFDSTSLHKATKLTLKIPIKHNRSFSANYHRAGSPLM